VLGALNFGAGGWEHGSVRMLPTGKVEVVTGTSPHGQGHATAWAMLASEELGIDVDKITVKWGDTDLIPEGGGTGGSRSLQQGGAAVQLDGDDIGGVVTGPAGPEAGVWVIAETTDLPTKFAKIVVTDDQGRYVLPDLPKANYSL